jgi:hypothetical protein
MHSPSRSAAWLSSEVEPPCCSRPLPSFHLFWRRRYSTGPHPHGFIEIAAACVGLAGAAAVLVFVVLLLRPYELGFAVRAGATYRELWRDDLTDQAAVDLALAEMFEQRRNRNTNTVRRLERLLGLALAALVIETGGLALAAAPAS